MENGCIVPINTIMPEHMRVLIMGFKRPVMLESGLTRLLVQASSLGQS
ncbi:hypothetical protein OP10G_3825 [Fimbriimonas ginsengisoli Gsoil 348]|uniref:Uncharacterized protein n=1 Tax=Fimbriimonas ginsengisoli Gsoil 348 TaxID=661478 RepID=A0A068NUI6_FIMGI|nr:hypothetical protein OP10G_3825 [Fimbriimonas ginsengisoli Gsoil 348]